MKQNELEKITFQDLEIILQLMFVKIASGFFFLTLLAYIQVLIYYYCRVLLFFSIIKSDIHYTTSMHLTVFPSNEGTLDF